MKRRLLERWREYLRERRAAAWVVRLDEDPARYEEGLRRWIGDDQEKAAAYNQAYQAFHGASAAARQIFARTAARPAPRRLARKVNLALVTGLSLIVVSGALLFMLEELDMLARHPVPAAQLYATKVGEVRSVRLSDGSKLIVDTDTIVRVTFSPTARAITLVKGRVRFDVAHNAARPFIVSAGGARIADRGTVFDVEAYRLVSVRILSGTVDVSLPGRGGTARPAAIHLRPGQQLRFDPAMNDPPEAPQATPVSDLQWVSGMKTFDGVPVSEIIEEVNRYSTTKIKLADPAMGVRPAFLDLDIRDSSEVAQNLALYLRLDVDASEANALILRSQQVASEKE